MENAMINKSKVKSNKIIKQLQKNSKKYFKLQSKEAKKADRSMLRATKLKMRLDKVVSLDTTVVRDLTGKATEDRTMEKMNLEQLKSSLVASNLTGLSGNGFATSTKIDKLLLSKVKEKHFIINAVECDPGLIHDSWIAKNKAKEIEETALYLKSVLNLQTVQIASKENLSRFYTQLPCVVVPDRYPMGHERFVTECVTGIHLEIGEFPTDRGVLVMNVQTVLAIYELLCGGNFDSRYITVANVLTGETTVTRVLLGADAREVANQVLSMPQGGSLCLGGGIMSSHVAEKNEKITATTDFVGVVEVPYYNNSEMCRGCGACASKCPMGIPVNQIVRLQTKGQNVPKDAFPINQCIGCGTCTYVCPAGRANHEMIKHLREE